MREKPCGEGAAGNVLSDGVNRYLYDGEGRLCAYQNVAVAGNYGPMMGYVYGPDGLRVGKGTISTWTCNPLTAGFAMTASYVLGPGGEQVSEMAVTGTYGNYSSSWQHTNVFANGSLLATPGTTPQHMTSCTSGGSNLSPRRSSGASNQGGQTGGIKMRSRSCWLR